MNNHPLHLRCNDLDNPLGVETPRPRLSWRLVPGGHGQRQTGYEIRVASTREALDRGEADLWASGEVASLGTLGATYAGVPLRSRQSAWWQVRSRDAAGAFGPWSEPACWEMGLLKAGDWRARWIAPVEYALNTPSPAPYLRRTIALSGSIRKARAYIAGLGYHELSINGQRIGDDLLAPAFSRYDRTIYYQTRDVTAALRAGANTIGVILGNGWYNCFTAEVWDFKQAPWRAQPKLRFQLEIEFEDGRRQTVASDTNWRSATGPIVFDGLRNGETYDARLEQPEWDRPRFDEASWKPVRIVPPPGGTMRSQQFPPIRVTGTLRPRSCREVKPGVWIADLGQDIAGWARLRATGPAGTEITLRYAEKLGADGDIDPSNINWFIKSGECQTDRFILKGAGEELFEPRFTYHGFQYIQITGYPGSPSCEAIEGRVVHTDLLSRGEFVCSNPLLNAIQQAARWSTLGNYHGIPTDCPHREKNGWTGDAHLSAEQVLFNFNPVAAYRKWLRDFHDVQRDSGQLPGIVPTGGWGYNWGSGPAWDSALILIPWYLYLYEGDTEGLAENYPFMKRYVDYMTSMATGHLVNFGLGDWCPPVGGAGAHKCPTEVTDTAYYFIDTHLLATIAAVLGRGADAKRYGQLAGRIRKAFQKRYLDPKTGLVTGNTQTSMACALYQGLVDEADQPAVFAALIAEVEAQKRHIDCGILGAKYLLHTLTDLGRADLAYAIATQTDYPSWGLWIAQGATTLWENWDGKCSRNHHMYSDISAWFYRGLAGIMPDPSAPGFRRVIIAPNPVAGLEWVKAWHEAPQGRIVSNWSVREGLFRLDVEFPPDTEGEVHLPLAASTAILVEGQPAESAPGVSDQGRDRLGRRVFRLVSGRHTLTARTG